MPGLQLSVGAGPRIAEIPMICTAATQLVSADSYEAASPSHPEAVGALRCVPGLAA